MDVKESEIDDLFYKYGRIRDIEIKRPQRPPAFCFISFDDYRDAEDAIRGRYGRCTVRQRQDSFIKIKL